MRPIWTTNKQKSFSPRSKPKLQIAGCAFESQRQECWCFGQQFAERLCDHGQWLWHGQRVWSAQLLGELEEASQLGEDGACVWDDQADGDQQPLSVRRRGVTSFWNIPRLPCRTRGERIRWENGEEEDEEGREKKSLIIISWLIFADLSMFWKCIVQEAERIYMNLLWLKMRLECLLWQSGSIVLFLIFLLTLFLIQVIFIDFLSHSGRVLKVDNSYVDTFLAQLSRRFFNAVESDR